MPIAFDDYLEHLSSLIAATERLLTDCAPQTPVPGCPDWDAAELRDHTAGVLAFWTEQLRVADAAADGPHFPEDVRDRYKQSLSRLGAECLSELRRTGEAGPCWNWSGGNPTAGWVARRMANEFAVHHADALAVNDRVPRIDSEMAADGIDELLEVFVGAQIDESGAAGVVRFEADNGRSWTVLVGDGAMLTDREPTAWVTGSVDQLLLHLWGRPVDVAETGDSAVMERWRAMPVFG